PAISFYGTDSFTYEAVNHSGALSNVATVALNVVPVPGHVSPVVNDSYTTPPATKLSVAAPGVLANDADQSLLAQLVVGPAHGTLSLHADGGYVYTPNPGYYGFESFTFQVSDGWLLSDARKVDMYVTPASDDSYAIPINSTLTVSANQGVLHNDVSQG